MHRELQELISMMIVSHQNTEWILTGYILSKFDVSFITKSKGDESILTAYLGYSGGRFYIRIYKDFFDSLSIEQKAAVLQHEVAHFINKHFARRNERHSKIWNIACDMAINQYIRNLPDNCIALPNGWPKHATAEEYYQLIEKHGCVKVKNIQLFDWIEDGKQNPQESELDADGIINRTLSDLQNQQSIDKQSLRGLYGGALKHVIDTMHKVKGIAPWKKVLRKFTATIATNKILSIKRPDRRNSSSIYGKQKEYKPKMILAIDTSGSISDNILNTFMNQIDRISKQTAELRVITCDAKIDIDETYQKYRCHKFSEIEGRGGTDYDPVINRVNKQYKSYDGLIYLTDGECPLPTSKPKIPVLWALTYDNKHFNGKPKIVVTTDE